MQKFVNYQKKLRWICTKTHLKYEANFLFLLNYFSSLNLSQSMCLLFPDVRPRIYHRRWHSVRQIQPIKFKDETVLFTTNWDIQILCCWGEKALGLSTTKRKTVKTIKEQVEVYCGKHCHNLLVSHNLWVFVVCYKQKLFHYCLGNANIIILQGKKNSPHAAWT